jgi:hypothetical protein
LGITRRLALRRGGVDGSSWLRLPAALRRLTGDIGFHHVHHLDRECRAIAWSRRTRPCIRCTHAPAQPRSRVDGTVAHPMGRSGSRLVGFRHARRPA